MRNSTGIFGILTIIGLTSSAAIAGPDWIEPPCPGGAGGTQGTSEGTNGSGPLGSITGELCGPIVIAVGGVDADYEDVYRIRICDPSKFSAETSAEFNAQLWLFTEDGEGLIANDDQ